MDKRDLNLDLMVDTLKAAAEPSRLRILALLSRGDLTVSDLTSILGQSQPRVSRHLKLLFEANLINRYQEGSWAYFRLAESLVVGDIARILLDRLDVSDPLLERDIERLGSVKLQRRERAAAYFSANATSWDAIRSLHVPDGAVEAALTKIIGRTPFQAMLDVGTGTGRLLELFAPLYVRGVGIDINRDMLTIARSNLDRSIKSLPLAVLRPRPIAEAISSAGGIRLDAIDDGYMLKALPGVFAAGEMLDWEAPTGGYLLTACFATGRAAARGMEAWLDR